MYSLEILEINIIKIINIIIIFSNSLRDSFPHHPWGRVIWCVNLFFYSGRLPRRPTKPLVIVLSARLIQDSVRHSYILQLSRQYIMLLKFFSYHGNHMLILLSIIIFFFFNIFQTSLFIVFNHFFSQKSVFRMPHFVQHSQGSNDLWDGDKLLHIVGAVLELPLDLHRKNPSFRGRP